MLPNIHILGIQGSGKGTQAGLLEKKYGFTSMASGNLFRLRAQKQDDFGQDIANKLATGYLLPDEYVTRIITDFFASHTIEKGLLGDGVIRTISQYDGFMSIWEAHNMSQPFLIHLKLSDEEALKRIAKRGKDDLVERHDITSEAIQHRIHDYHVLTEPVIDRFQKVNRIVTIDASDSIEVVFSHISTALEKAFPHLEQV